MLSLRPTGRLLASVLTSMLVAGGVIAETAEAQVQVPFAKRYYPLDQTVPPGKAGHWSAHRDPTLLRGYFQPVQVELPQAAKVTFFAGIPEQTVEQPSPASAALLVGPWYRLKVSDITGYPGVVLYPTVELLDRLHPPAGKAAHYPIPVTISDEEINAVLQGRLVTKFVYLEQPSTAYVGPSPEKVRNRIGNPRENAIAIADHHGRPMAIVRIGGRVAAPGGHGEDPGFYGVGAPVKKVPAPPPEK